MESLESSTKPCCTHNIIIKNLEMGDAQMAIFEKSDIWKQLTKGSVHITFGDTKYKHCGPDKAWAIKGRTTFKPSMNLGFIDPPLEDFEFNNKIYKFELFENEHRNGYRKKTKDKWIPGSTVVHEFCHVLGMDHEHQNNLNNSNKINFNVDNIIKSYENYEDAKTNVLDLYSNKKMYTGSNFDKDSIMLYYFDDDWIIGENPTKPNHKLSEKDILWLSKIYPKKPKVTNFLYPQMNIYFIDKNSEIGPEWKKAWVMKTVTECLFPYIGIKAIFYDNDNTILYIYDSDIESESDSESRTADFNRDFPTDFGVDSL